LYVSFRFVSFIFEFGLSAKQCDQTAPPMSSVDSWDAASSSFRRQHTKVHRASDEGGDWHGRNNDDEMATGDVGTDSVVATAASVRRARHHHNAPQFPSAVCEANLAKIHSKSGGEKKREAGGNGSVAHNIPNIPGIPLNGSRGHNHRFRGRRERKKEAER
jgi:hypothetical protein